MAREEKAKELVEKFRSKMQNGYWAKSCALVCVDENIKAYNKVLETWHDERGRTRGMNHTQANRIRDLIKEEEEVKTEINKL